MVESVKPPVHHPSAPPKIHPARPATATNNPFPTPANRAQQNANRRNDARDKASDLDQPDREVADIFSDSNDGMFFEQLLSFNGGGGNGSQQQQQSDDSFGSSTTGPLAPSAMNELVEELSFALPTEARQPLNITLFMPNLGRIGVKAMQTMGNWDIELAFAQVLAKAKVEASHSECEAAMSKALGRRVSLRLRNV